MNTLDIIIIILLLWGAIKGFISGLIVQALMLAALVLGVWGGIEFSGFAAVYLAKWLSISIKVSQVLSFVLIFVIVLVIIYLMAKLLTDKLGKGSFGKLNRIGGVIFGMFRMAFMASVLVVIIQRVDVNRKLLTPETTHASKLYTPVSKIAPAIFPHLHFETFKNKLLKEEDTKPEQSPNKPTK
jgi:membrane protein required for colicin V production